MSEQNCPNCGAPSAALGRDGLIYISSSTSYPALIHLFNKDWDEDRCELAGCGKSLGTRPTCAILFTDLRVALVVLGTRMQGQFAEFADQIKQVGDQVGHQIFLYECPSFDSLREETTRLLQPHIAVVQALLQTPVDQVPAYIAAHWREVTPQVCAAGAAFLNAPLPSVPPPTQTAHRANILSAAQALVWYHLLASWLGQEHGKSLEGDLEHYIDPPAVLPTAPERLFHLLQHFLDSRPEHPHRTRYCLEALRATVCHASDQSNPYARIWAELFFAHELAFRDGRAQNPTELQALLISENRARATINIREASDTLAGQLNILPVLPLSEWLRHVGLLEQIAAKAGHPDLVHRVITQHVQIISPEPIPVEGLIESMRLSTKILGTTHGLIQGSRPFFQPLLTERRIEDLERLADGITEVLGGTPNARAEAEVWLGSCLNKLREPRRFLDRIGETVRDWESDLPSEVRASLWNERANALRRLGRADPALQLINKVLELPEGAITLTDRRIVQMNAAMLTCEMGSPDKALDMLGELLKETPEQDQLGLRESYAGTLVKVGHFDEAITWYDRALQLATGPHADCVLHLQANRAQILAVLRRDDEAVHGLLEVPGGDEVDPMVQLTAASSWLILLSDKVPLSQTAWERVNQLPNQLQRLASAAKARGDVPVYLGALRLGALLADLTNNPDSESLWTLVRAEGDKLGVPPDPVELVFLARFAYSRGDVVKGRTYLSAVPTALAAAVGGVADLAVVARRGTMGMRNVLNQLVNELLEHKADWADLRLAAEMRRDAVGRAQGLRRQVGCTGGLPPEGLTGQVLAHLASKDEWLFVLEWIDDGEKIASFLTCVAPTGEVNSYWLRQPPVDLRRLGKRMTDRLRNWIPSRPGEPFDLDDWHRLEEWFIESVSPHVPAGGHVLILEHSEYMGFPWHVAAAPRWSSSYAASWTTLLALRTRPARPCIDSLGLVFVPKFREELETLQAMRDSASRTRAFAAKQGLDFFPAAEGEADHAALDRIMGASAVVKLLCHGFIDANDGEVALLLARNGSLPLLDSVVAGSAVGRAHRLSWRQWQQLQTVPERVFSAACSTGLSLGAGLGERLGLFAALRHAGTRTLIAPRWDMVAANVLPILDNTLESFVSEGGALGRVLHRACLAAADAGIPRWLAWNLALEGDWR